MPLSDNYKTEKELGILAEALNETIDLFINDDQLKIKKKGFVLFIIDYKTGVTQITTSCNPDDVIEMLRIYVQAEDDKKKKIIS